MSVCRKAAMASSEELLQSIRPGMKLNKVFFLRVYGYEITWPGFAETAIKALEDAGCSNARNYYDSIVARYEESYRQSIKEAGAWYLALCKNEWKKRGSDEQRRQKITLDLLQKSDRELLNLLQTLN